MQKCLGNKYQIIRSEDNGIATCIATFSVVSRLVLRLLDVAKMRTYRSSSVSRVVFTIELVYSLLILRAYCDSLSDHLLCNDNRYLWCTKAQRWPMLARWNHSRPSGPPGYLLAPPLHLVPVVVVFGRLSSMWAISWSTW